MAFSPAFRGDLSALAQRYIDVRRTTEDLCAPLTAEDQMVQSMPEASPAKWHQAHTTWFFETFVLAPHLTGYRPFDPNFRFLFNSYYKQVDGPTLPGVAGVGSPHPQRALRGSFSRPSLEQVRDYRRYVDDHIVRLLNDDAPDVASVVELGTHHEQQHQELILTDIKHAFSTHPLRPSFFGGGCSFWDSKATATNDRPSKRASNSLQPVPQSKNLVSSDELPLEWVPFRGGVVEIGHDGEEFAFDNEMPAHDVILEPYRLGSRLVTNGDYLEFINDGGYTHSELWLSDGWDRVCSDHWGAPLYWEQRDGSWHEFTLHGMQPIDPASPVCHVSYYEADAFARWAGARLPREEEWENAAKQSAVASRRLSANLLETGVLHPLPVASEEQLATRDQRLATQVFGDVWEWTGSAYLAYPGYRSDPGALGEYNGKFMSGQMVLRGGSCATPLSHIRPTYRNFFPPQARWQFMGIRLANDGD